MKSTTTATPTKPLSAKELLALRALALDEDPEVKPLAAAAEATDHHSVDLVMLYQRAKTLNDRHYNLDREVDPAERLDALANAPNEAEVARARQARDAAFKRLEHARETAIQKRLWKLHEFRKSELATLSADYARLVERYAPLLEVEQAFHETWPTRVCDRYGALVSAERLEAWRAAARTEGFDV